MYEKEYTGVVHLGKSLKKRIEEGLENGEITADELSDMVPPCKACVYKAIGSLIFIATIMFILGGLIF